MISYELQGYNSITSVVLYMTNNIYVCHLHEHSFTIVLHYVLICSAYPAMRSYHSPCFSEKHTCILFSILHYFKIIIDIPYK